jgi:adenine-specific DNA-methyltransferase
MSETPHGSTNFAPQAKAPLLEEVERFRQRVERRRVDTSAQLGESRSRLGQFFTPPEAAGLLAGMVRSSRTWRLLDPGAGVGSLTAALVCRWLLETERPDMDVLAYELDAQVTPGLRETLDEAVSLASRFGRTLRPLIRQADFVLEPPERGESNVVLMNPPYRKLSVRSAEAIALRDGEEPVRATNLYAAFLLRAIRALPDDGQLVAITPRSFANGPYFRELRAELLKRASFDRIHAFTARDRVFADADVLQENMVFSMTTGAKAGEVTLTSSPDASSPATVRRCDHAQIVHLDDDARFIRLPLDQAAVECAEDMLEMPAVLSDLDIAVSTGRVVDFRARKYLRASPRVGLVPLVYPQNIRSGSVNWPLDRRKPQALEVCDETSSLLLPNENYVLVKRFTSREESRRVVAAVSYPSDYPGASLVAFENHLNVFHHKGRGLDRALAEGLAAYLNSDLVDACVRQFNGHTQINATDLREIRYPSVESLRALEVGGIRRDEVVFGREEPAEFAA